MATAADDASRDVSAAPHGRRGALALAALATVLCLALGEVGMRLAGIGPGPRRLGDAPAPGEGAVAEDPTLGWRNRPGATVVSPEPGHALRHFWWDGQRASAPQPHDAAARPVALLGCSFTAAEGVRDEDTYAWGLNAAFPELRFENLGVDGYGTYQALLVLRGLRERPPERRPALVLYGFIGDHERRNVATFRWIRFLRTSRALYAVPPHVTLEDDGRLAEHPMSWIDAWPGEARSVWLTLLHDAWLRLRFAGRDGTRREATRRLILELDGTARGMGAGFLTVLLDNVPEGTREFLAERGVRFVDCVHPDAGRDPSLKVGGVGHPSAAQHAFWTTCLREALEREPVLAAR